MWLRERLLPLDPIHENEIGKLMAFFNSMVGSLKIKTDEVQNLIDRLSESESSYKSLVELSPEAVFVHQNGIIKYINHSGVKMFGAVNAQDLIGKDLMDVVHPESHEHVTARIKKYTPNGCPCILLNINLLPLTA